MGFRVYFYLAFALVAIISSLLMVTRKNPIHSALWLILTFGALAVLYLLHEAQFIAVAQVMVYAGAIMMLILFVIMLVNLEKVNGEGEAEIIPLKRKKMVWIIISTILLVELLFCVLFFRLTGKTGDYPVEMVRSMGNAKTVGSLLYGYYLFPFEIASLLLLVGIVGAVVLTKRAKGTEEE